MANLDNHLIHLRKQRKTFYDQIGSIEAPVLSGKVHFTSTGFKHLLYKNNGKARNKKEQALKLQWVREAPDVVKGATAMEEMRRLRVGKKGREKEILLIALKQNVKGTVVKVIVEQMRTQGDYRFVSVMPQGKSWRKYRPTPSAGRRVKARRKTKKRP